jgi:hypothetical protein
LYQEQKEYLRRCNKRSYQYLEEKDYLNKHKSYNKDMCPCKEPGWCEEYKMMMVGRLWDICHMDNETGDKYRELWKKMAQTKGDRKPVTEKKGGCGCRKG